MKSISHLCKLAVLTAFLFGIAQAAPKIGQAAPDFSLTDISGQRHSLSEYKGKIVVLEWVNPECPFVKKQYDKSGNMPALQKAAAGDGVVWLSINSSAPGTDGDLDAADVRAWQKRVGAAATAYCQDRDGTVGHLYDARTTPHMFIVNAAGMLVYAGGIDSIRSADPADIAKATNYVKAALADLEAGQPVRIPTSKPYGCGVHYAR